MFKMGCSMARKILAIDSKGSSSGSSSNESNQKKSKYKQSAEQSSKSNKAASGDELNDFSKLESDPRIPLNVRQIFKITKSWKAIARTMSKTGTAMFLNLFEQNQDLFYLFDRFQHLKGQELHDSMELREHAATVMSTLDQSINSLSDYDNFVTYLHSIGKLHRKVPGFKREHFWKIEQPFLKAVKQTLDERCNETIEEIYKIAIKLIIETISVGYGEDDNDNSKQNASKKPPGSEQGGAGGGGSGKNQDKSDNNFDNNNNNNNDNNNNSDKGNIASNDKKNVNGDNFKQSSERREIDLNHNNVNLEEDETKIKKHNLYSSLKAIALLLANKQPNQEIHCNPQINKQEPLKEALFVLRELLKSAISQARQQ